MLALVLCFLLFAVVCFVLCCSRSVLDRRRRGGGESVSNLWRLLVKSWCGSNSSGGSLVGEKKKKRHCLQVFRKQTRGRIGAHGSTAPRVQSRGNPGPDANRLGPELVLGLAGVLGSHLLVRQLQPQFNPLLGPRRGGGEREGAGGGGGGAPVFQKQNPPFWESGCFFWGVRWPEKRKIRLGKLQACT